jgi:cytidylate kinase
MVVRFLQPNHVGSLTGRGARRIAVIRGWPSAPIAEGDSMSQTPSLIDHRLQLLRRHWHQSPLQQHPRREPPPSQRMVVAISREAGTPGKEIADAIGERLDWPVYDREILDMIARESGLRGDLLAAFDEHDAHWLVEALASFGQNPAVNSTKFVHHLVRVLGALAARGRCVIVGRGAVAFLPPETTLRVLLVADLDDRVRRFVRENQLTEKEARRAVQQIDQSRSQFVAAHFHRDVGDAHNFDVVLNASRLDIAACAVVAVEALQTLRSRVERGEVEKPGNVAVH